MIAWETCVFALLTDDKPPPNVRMWGKSIERIVGPSIYPMHKYVHFIYVCMQLSGQEHGTICLSMHRQHQLNWREVPKNWSYEKAKGCIRYPSWIQNRNDCFDNQVQYTGAAVDKSKSDFLILSSRASLAEAHHRKRLREGF